MRIVPVTGDLPAVVVPPPAVAPASEAPRTASPVVEAAGRSRGASSEQTADRRAARPLLPFFDPPLIAQRAALGLPVGTLIAGFAQAKGISYSAASAAVDDELAERHEGRP